MNALIESLLLQAGHNAALVGLGAAMLGVAAGICGSYLALRKRALVADGIAHATLPGIALAFLVMVALGGDGRNLAGLIAGSALSAAAGLLAIDWITRKTRLAEDAAIGAVLSAFFGFGIVLLTLIQGLPGGKQAGLQGFLLGSTAGMLQRDAMLIAAGAVLALALCWLMRRPFTLLGFDPEFAVATGLATRRYDLALLALAGGVTLLGLQLVGLVLIVALLIIPPVAARFWTNRLGMMIGLAGLFGGLSAYIGAALSAAFAKVPTGPAIVLVAFAIFLVSFIAGPARGVIAGFAARRAALTRQG